MAARLKWLGCISVVTVALLGLWMLRDASEGRVSTLPINTGDRPSVRIRQGKIYGVEVRNGYPQVMDEFLGIPFALSTEGERRFRPPVPIGASTEGFDAGRHGDRCPSGSREGSSEDCLNLNIYRPRDRVYLGVRLPVLVYVHGGAFNFGAGKSRQISLLTAWSAEPMLGISFNYRVGALGFLPSKLTVKEGLLNIGLKDQRMLLEWVHENIAAFGGDPDNVTIMGSSAGAHSVCCTFCGRPLGLIFGPVRCQHALQ